MIEVEIYWIIDCSGTLVQSCFDTNYDGFVWLLSLLILCSSLPVIVLAPLPFGIASENRSDFLLCFHNLLDKLLVTTLSIIKPPWNSIWTLPWCHRTLHLFTISYINYFLCIICITCYLHYPCATLTVTCSDSFALVSILCSIALYCKNGRISVLLKAIFLNIHFFIYT